MGILFAVRDFVIRVNHAVKAKVEADLLVDELSIECIHQELGACQDCKNDWICGKVA